MWMIIPELNDFVAHETDHTVAAGTSIKEGELHFDSPNDQTDSINLSQIRLCVPLDCLHQFDLIKDGVIDYIY